MCVCFFFCVLHIPGLVPSGAYEARACGLAGASGPGSSTEPTLSRRARIMTVVTAGS